MIISNQDITKPLIDSEDNIQSLNKLMEKCKKKAEKKRKLEKNALKEINSYLLEINDRLTNLITYQLNNPKDKSNLNLEYKHDSIEAQLNNEINPNVSLAFIAMGLESFTLFMKDKLNIQMNRLQNFEKINNKLLDDEDEVIETIRVHNEATNKNLIEVKKVLDMLEVVEETYNQMHKKGPKIQKRKFSTDEDVMKQRNNKLQTDLKVDSTCSEDFKNYNQVNKEFKTLNKWLGFFTFLLFFGSFLILFLFLWKNA